jgi:hypothetical protein
VDVPRSCIFFLKKGLGKFNLFRSFSKIVERTQPYVKVVTTDKISGLLVTRPQNSTEVSSVKTQGLCKQEKYDVTIMKVKAMLICFQYIRGIIYYKFVCLWSLLLGSVELFSRALLKGPPVLWPLSTFPAFYGTQSFVTAFTRALHLSLSWARPVKSVVKNSDH